MKYSFARSFDRKKRGVHARAAALRDRVEADVDSGASNVGGRGALIQSRSGIRVAHQRNREATNFEFMPQQPRKSQGDIFLGQRIGQRRTPLFATVRGIDHGENAMDINIGIGIGIDVALPEAMFAPGADSGGACVGILRSRSNDIRRRWCLRRGNDESKS